MSNIATVEVEFMIEPDDCVFYSIKYKYSNQYWWIVKVYLILFSMETVKLLIDN